MLPVRIDGKIQVLSIKVGNSHAFGPGRRLCHWAIDLRTLEGGVREKDKNSPPCGCQVGAILIVSSE